MSDLHRQLSLYLMVKYHVSAHMIATASNLTTAKSFLDSCLLCTSPNSIASERLLLDLCSARYLFVTKCCHTSLGGRVGVGVGVGQFLS